MRRIYAYNGKVALIVSLVFVGLLALPDYSGQAHVAGIVRGFSECIAEWIPQMNLITAERENPVGSRISLVSVIAMAPIQFGYYLFGLVRGSIRQRYLFENNFSEYARLALAALMMSVVVILAFNIQISSSMASSKSLGRMLYPVLKNDVFYVAFMEILVFGAVVVWATVTYVCLRRFDKKEK